MITKIKTTTKAKIDWLSEPICGLRCLAVGAAEPFRDEPFAAEGVQVPRHGVVESQEGREDAGDEQQRHDRRERRSDVGRTKDEQERCRVRLQAGEVFLQTCRALGPRPSGRW